MCPHRRGHLGGGVDVLPDDTDRGRFAGWPRDQHDVCTAAPGRFREAESHLATRAIGDDPNRIEWLPRWTGSHQNLSASERAVAVQGAFGVGNDLPRLDHSPWPIRRALGKRTNRRSDHPPPPGHEQRDIRCGRVGGIHRIVHRGGEQHRFRGREEQRGEQVVGHPRRCARDQVRGRRGHDDQIGVLAQGEMVERPATLPQGGANGASGDGFERRATDEFSRTTGQDDVHEGTAGRELASHQHALVGRDPPGHAEDDMAAPPHLRPRCGADGVRGTSAHRS